MSAKEQEQIVLWEGEWLAVRQAVKATRLWWRGQVLTGANEALDSVSKSIRQGGQQVVGQLGSADSAMRELNAAHPFAFPAITLSSVLGGSYWTSRLMNAHFPKSCAVFYTSLAAFLVLPTTVCQVFLHPHQDCPRGVGEPPRHILRRSGEEGVIPMQEPMHSTAHLLACASLYSTPFVVNFPLTIH
eukprot:GGOE01055324.1.p1 GENE.GGOE01055324.1~~GGOE01055324.1.p1  ORF type:complete len:208 (-),score=26.99 GGOE01055324.1:170-730(-)